MKRPARIAAFAVTAAVAVPAVPATAVAADGPCYSPPGKPQVVSRVKYRNMQTLLYCYGPITIKPGQNTIDFSGPLPYPYGDGLPVAATSLRPPKNGYITRWDPDLIYADKTKGTKGVPSVDVLHLHHGVWLVNNNFMNPQWAAGEEKTVIQLPKGFGWRNRDTDRVQVNYMIHNLYPTTEKVYLTWRVDFVPDSSPDAKNIKQVDTLWMDVSGLKAYPVFNALRGMGSGGRYTFPDQTTDSGERAKVGERASFTATRDMTLIQTFGHLHPGGLKTNLSVQRGSTKKSLFDSVAKYWEPAGAVSWDVAMTGTPANWRVKVKPGDVLTTSATYDVSKASWYESMGIMPIAVRYRHDAGGVDPFTSSLPKTGATTHGHLAENNNHGGKTVVLNDFTNFATFPNRPVASGTVVPIKDFVYSLGDMSASGLPANPPTVAQGGYIRFRNDDSTGNPNTDFIYHTITACKAPCNKDTGIAYPLADGPIEFDSGQLGFGPANATPTENRKYWNTPTTLPSGNYTYFCRVHPYMRGAFRVSG